MGAELIQGQHLADSFLALLPQPSSTPAIPVNADGQSGSIAFADLPLDLQTKLSDLLAPNDFSGNRIAGLFGGDVSTHGGDHSAADLALVGHLARSGLTPDEVDQAFRASKLYRAKWDEMRGEVTYGQRTISKAFSDLPIAAATEPKPDHHHLGDMLRHRPVYVPEGMPARRFVGPHVDAGVRLFPAMSLSAFVALGATGKTSLLIAIATHVAAGKVWNGQSLQQNKVVVFSVEETQGELNRKFSALVDSWTPTERQAAIDNLLLVSLLGQDARLTVNLRSQYSGSGVAEKMIGLIESFGLKDGLVILDHMQGFASGDLNVSETATAICREANKIVEATGAAVVFAAHISKANIGATELEQGFAVGSLAFENAVRQMAGMITMTEDQAKRFGLELTRKEYVWLGVPKNSYGASAGGTWLRKVYSQKYHTVFMEPVQLSIPIAAGKKSANEKLADRLNDYLTQHPWTTKNQLDGNAGEDGPLKASKAKVRDVLGGMVDAGEIELYRVSDDERQQQNLPKQVKEVLRVKPAGRPAKPNPPTGGHQLDRRP